IRKITPDGTVTTLPGTAALPGTIESVRHLALDGAGNLYAAGFSRVSKITPSGIITTFKEFNGVQDLKFPITGVAVDGAGAVYVARVAIGVPVPSVTALGWVLRFNAQGTEVRYPGITGVPGSATVEYPAGITADSAGNVFVACAGTVNGKVCSSIKRISPTGDLTIVAGTNANGSADGIGTSASFRRPQGVKLGPQGELLVADTDNHTIRVIAP
ncbi:MAG: hypothetical protein ABIT82_02660, partial [Ramlibacter sp.]